MEFHILLEKKLEGSFQKGERLWQKRKQKI